MKHERDGMNVEKMLGSLRDVPPPDGERQASSRAEFLSRAGRYRAAAVPPVRGASHNRWLPALTSGSWMGLARVGTVVAMVLVLVLGTGGILYAAEASAPGDALYGIDQAMESARLSLTSEPQAVMELLLSFGEERLQEAEKLSAKGDAGNLDLALQGYGTTIAALAQTLSAVGGIEGSALAEVIDQSFSVHEAQLAGVLQDAEDDEEEQGNGEAAEGCTGASIHRVAESLAASYSVPYDQIMTWFCVENFGLGEIMHALETGEETGVPAADLLALKTELGGWGRVWQGLGLIGRPEDAPFGPPEDRPVGPPEDKQVGPPEDRPVGPPEDKQVGPPEDRPVGPPEDKQVGPPEDRPVGPPEDKPGGPPEDKPVGPPEDKPGGPPEDKPAGPPDTGALPGSGAEYCVGADPHPRATELAAEYGVAYETIMAWFCEDGYGFGDIMLALKTSQEANTSAQALLDRKSELKGWGQVWQEEGLIGKPEDKPAGPPEGKPVGPDKEKPNGKP